MGVPLRRQSPNGIVSSVLFVSTTNTARSLAGFVSLALALTPWRSPGSSEKLLDPAAEVSAFGGTHDLTRVGRQQSARAAVNRRSPRLDGWQFMRRAPARAARRGRWRRSRGRGRGLPAASGRTTARRRPRQPGGRAAPGFAATARYPRSTRPGARRVRERTRSRRGAALGADLARALMARCRASFFHRREDGSP